MGRNENFQKEFDEGKAAYYDEKSIDDNPYEEGTGEYDEWGNGYLEAEDEDPLGDEENEDDCDDDEL